MNRLFFIKKVFNKFRFIVKYILENLIDVSRKFIAKNEINIETIFN